MKFWKMNGAGNDFIILNNLEERLPLEAIPQIARTLCRRRMSIGADGLMVVEAADQGGDFKMLFFNSDGSVGEMCGNGARCQGGPGRGDHRRNGVWPENRPPALPGPPQRPRHDKTGLPGGGGRRAVRLFLRGAGGPGTAPRGGPVPQPAKRR